MAKNTNQNQEPKVRQYFTADDNNMIKYVTLKIL